MRSLARSLGAAVLCFEALVVFFAGLVAKNLTSLPAGAAVGGAGIVAGLLLLAAGLLRSRAGFALGWLLQVVLIATGVWVPAMFVLGALFAGLWAWAIRAGLRIDRARS